MTDDDSGVGTDDATITVLNLAPTAEAGGPYTVDEGSSIVLSGTATDPSSLDTLTFAGTVGETRTFTVAINNDNVVELSETFDLSMNNLLPVTAPGSAIDITDEAVGTITDNDSATFTIDDVTVNEADGTMTFTVSLDEQIDTEVVVDVGYTNVTATGGGAAWRRRKLSGRQLTSRSSPMAKPMAGSSGPPSSCTSPS